MHVGFPEIRNRLRIQEIVRVSEVINRSFTKYQLVTFTLTSKTTSPPAVVASDPSDPLSVVSVRLLSLKGLYHRSLSIHVRI